MSCDLAALPFQAHDNYGTWSIDVEKDYDFPYIKVRGQNCCSRRIYRVALFTSTNMIMHLLTVYLPCSYNYTIIIRGMVRGIQGGGRWQVKAGNG